MKEWKTKFSSKLQLLLMYLIGVYFFVKLLTYKPWRVENSADLLSSYEGVQMFLLILFPFTIAFLILIPFWIFRKKTPNSIKIDLSRKQLYLYYFIRKKEIINLSETAFSFKKRDYFSVLVLFKQIQARRGHMINRKLLSIVGLNLTTGWTTKQLREIARELEKVTPKAELKEKSFLEYIVN